MLTDGELAAVEGRLAAATPGPWIHTEGIAYKDYLGSENGDLYFSMQRMHPGDGRDVPAFENAEMIANAPADLRALLDDVAALRGLLAEARDSVPQVWDGAHLADCPYIDVLRGIRSRIDAALQGQAG